MKLLFIAFATLSVVACGEANSPKPQTVDSAAKKPDAGKEEQIPGTPGASGSDSTRPGALPKMTSNDSAR